MKNFTYFLIGFLLFSFTFVFSQSNTFQFKDGKEELTRFLNSLQLEDQPGFSLSIIKGDQILMKASEGLSNLKEKELISEHSIFYLASVAKTFTAVATIMLADERQLKLEDRISDYLKNLPPCTKDIRIYHLLNHTSGLPDHYDHFGEELPLPFTNKEVLAFVSKLDSLNFDPGGSYAYSNTAYVLLSEIISKVSGQSYAQFLESKIFKPLGMDSSFVLDEPKRLMNKSFALAYQNTGDGEFLLNPYEGIYTTGAGGVFSTNEDLVKWYTAIRNDVLISERQKQLMWHFPYIFKGQQSWMSMGWTNETFGRRTPGLEGLRVMGSIGVLKGYRTAFFMFPEHDFGFILLCNGGSFPFLSKEIAETFFEKQE